jgi:hypothetical protein
MWALPVKRARPGEPASVAATRHALREMRRRLAVGRDAERPDGIFGFSWLPSLSYHFALPGRSVFRDTKDPAIKFRDQGTPQAGFIYGLIFGQDSFRGLLR